MPSKQFKSALRRLRNGVPVGTGGRWFPGKPATFSIEITDSGKFRGSINIHGYGIAELWESKQLDTLRRIACGYYPSLCKHFGPARQFAGV